MIKQPRVLKEIRLIEEGELPQFFDYLDRQIAENGQGDIPLFQPMSRQIQSMSESMKSTFREGLHREFGVGAWRRLWIAVDEENHICGHIDLRPLAEPHTAHRALLGMGVDSDTRRMGLGKRLVDTVALWAKNAPKLDWIDLWVMSNNLPAIKLYQSTGFVKNGEIKEMFNIDDCFYSYINMSKRL